MLGQLDPQDILQKSARRIFLGGRPAVPVPDGGENSDDDRDNLGSVPAPCILEATHKLASASMWRNVMDC